MSKLIDKHSEQVVTLFILENRWSSLFWLDIKIDKIRVPKYTQINIVKTSICDKK